MRFVREDAMTNFTKINFSLVGCPVSLPFSLVCPVVDSFKLAPKRPKAPHRLLLAWADGSARIVSSAPYGLRPYPRSGGYAACRKDRATL